MREQEVRELYEAYQQVHQPKEQMNEEFETWVNDLVEEGYDLSDYTWEEMAEIYIDEAKSKLPTRGIDPELYSQFYGNASRSKKVKGKKTSQPGQNRYLAQQNQKRSAKRYEVDMGRDRTPSASDYDNHGGGSRNEETNLFDTILEHLVAEGFADTNEAALAIMANMSEEWRDSIVEDFPKVLNNYGTQGPNRSGDAGTRGLTKTPTGYINRHSRGEDLPPGTVNKIMGGNLMVKGQNKTDTKTA